MVVRLLVVVLALMLTLLQGHRPTVLADRFHGRVQVGRVQASTPLMALLRVVPGHLAQVASIDIGAAAALTGGSSLEGTRCLLERGVPTLRIVSNLFAIIRRALLRESGG